MKFTMFKRRQFADRRRNITVQHAYDLSACSNRKLQLFFSIIFWFFFFVLYIDSFDVLKMCSFIINWPKENAFAFYIFKLLVANRHDSPDKTHFKYYFRNVEITRPHFQYNFFSFFPQFNAKQKISHANSK